MFYAIKCLNINSATPRTLPPEMAAQLVPAPLVRHLIMPEKNTKYTTRAVWMESLLKEKDNCHNPYVDRTYIMFNGEFFSIRAREDILVQGSLSLLKRK
jgi:hypothetical protein